VFIHLLLVKKTKHAQPREATDTIITKTLIRTVKNKKTKHVPFPADKAFAVVICSFLIARLLRLEKTGVCVICRQIKREKKNNDSLPKYLQSGFPS